MFDEKDWEVFKQKLKKRTGIDLDLYKAAQMQRRIGNLMQRNGHTSYAAFFDSIEGDKAAFESFIEYLTINVSEFFRTPEKFSKLETDVLPDLLKKSAKLNIWSAGCSIGAEPYSLAMILKDMTPATRHRILATDLDIEILAKAKQGTYTDNELKSISPDRKHRYFTEANGKYMVKDDIKSCIEFKQHNMLKDPFEKGFDLILCRNVVIYFTDEAKDKLYRQFFDSLKPGGVLFVGATEAILNYRSMGFVSNQPFFYTKPV
ncbi:MAG: CheR family methyltransferase [Selenomonadaceae bacterium]